MLRPSNPADLLSLLVQARPQPIVACGRHSLASGRGDALPWDAMVEEWLLDRGRRHTWVLTDRGTPVGLVVCSRYKGPASWEIDLLQVSQGKEWASMGILDALNQPLGKMGAERLVLRLAEGSPHREAAMDAGFSPIVKERLFQRAPGEARSTPAASMTCRLGEETDIYQLYRLYCTAVPAPVRQMEGLALSDWQQSPASRDLPHEKRWVIEQDGQVTAAVTMFRGNGKRRLLDVLTDPRSPTPIAPALAEAVAAEGSRSTLLCLLPEYLWGTGSVEEALLEQAFEPITTLTVYVRPVVARVRSVSMLPVRA